MKSFKSIRIVMMSVLALVAFGFASKAIAAVDAFIWFKDSEGKMTKVKINHDGTFQTPPLRAGTYSFQWGVGRGIASTSSGGDRPQESVSLNFTRIEFKCQVQNPPDPARGVVTGKRMHKPISITKEVDKASPKLMTELCTVVIDANGETVSGTVNGMSTDGNKSAADSWDAK